MYRLIPKQNYQIEQSVVDENHEKAEKYIPAIMGQIRTYKANMDNKDYNIACSSAEQVAEMSLKAVARNGGRFSNTLENGHDLIKIMDCCTDSFRSVDIDKQDLKDLRNGYYAKYPNQPSHKTYNNREKAIELGKKAMEIADVALTELDVSSGTLDKEIGTLCNVTNVNDISIWNRLDIE